MSRPVTRSPSPSRLRCRVVMVEGPAAVLFQVQFLVNQFQKRLEGQAKMDKKASSRRSVPLFFQAARVVKPTVPRGADLPLVQAFQPPPVGQGALLASTAMEGIELPAPPPAEVETVSSTSAAVVAAVVRLLVKGDKEV